MLRNSIKDTSVLSVDNQLFIQKVKQVYGIQKKEKVQTGRVVFVRA